MGLMVVGDQGWRESVFLILEQSVQKETADASRAAIASAVSERKRGLAVVRFRYLFEHHFPANRRVGVVLVEGLGCLGLHEQVDRRPRVVQEDGEHPDESPSAEVTRSRSWEELMLDLSKRRFDRPALSVLFGEAPDGRLISAIFGGQFRVDTSAVDLLVRDERDVLDVIVGREIAPRELPFGLIEVEVLEASLFVVVVAVLALF